MSREHDRYSCGLAAGWSSGSSQAHNPEAAVTASFICGIDRTRLPLHDRFIDRIKLAKADEIPVCDDVVASEFQILHFDMGMPLAEGKNQLLVTHVAIYLPAATTGRTSARTRLVELSGLLSHLNLSAQELEHRLVDYVGRYGDGWGGINTRRLACFARLLDAVTGGMEVADETDRTVGQWFRSDAHLSSEVAHQLEMSFFARKGIDLGRAEVDVRLKPGDLLLLDNTRVIHGRVGRRRAREVCNFMFGVPHANAVDIAALRRFLTNTMVGNVTNDQGPTGRHGTRRHQAA